MAHGSLDSGHWPFEKSFGKSFGIPSKSYGTIYYIVCELKESKNWPSTKEYTRSGNSTSKRTSYWSAHFFQWFDWSKDAASTCQYLSCQGLPKPIPHFSIFFEKIKIWCSEIWPNTDLSSPRVTFHWATGRWSGQFRLPKFLLHGAVFWIVDTLF